MLKFVTISDTHSLHKQIKAFQGENALGGDVIIHAGDATNRGEPNEVRDFLKWFGELDFRYRIFIAGNHDFLFERNPTLAKQLCEENGVILLNHESIVIEGIKIFGSPWTPYFFNWAFNAGRSIAESALYKKPLIADLWKEIPSDTDILVTHGQPYLINDELCTIGGHPKGIFVGDVDLRKKIEEVKPDIYIGGHIHSGYGEKHIDGVSYYNASICDESYYPGNAPLIFEYKKE